MKGKSVILLFLIVLLILPMVQHMTGFVGVHPLKGAYTLQEKPSLTQESWIDNSYQTAFSMFMNDHLGFREWLIRLNNQLIWWLFHQANSPGCVGGKNNQLFLRSYIEGYLGMNFLGKGVINQKVSELKYLQDYFWLEGKTLFLVFAPGKAGFFPEYFPAEYRKKRPALNNHDYFVGCCNETGVNCIDFAEWFNRIKTTSQYPLYPQNGVHWTNYGMYLCMDSIIKYIETARGVNLPDLSIGEVIMTDSVAPPDNDVEVNMNLMFPIRQPSVPYPRFQFSDTGGTGRQKVLVISDSYYWQAYAAYISDRVFSFGGFWFYCNTAYNDQSWKGVPVDSLNVKQFLLDQDVIFIMGTEATLYLFPYDFLKKSGEYFRPKDRASQMAYYQGKIRQTPEWLASTAEKAKNNGETLDERINAEAAYMTNLQYSSMNPDDRFLADAVDKLKADTHFCENIQREAILSNIHPEVLFLREARKSIKNKPKQ